MKRYTIEFEASHKQWMVIDTKGPDAELGYHYDKADAQGVADMLNQRTELLAALEYIERVAAINAGPGLVDIRITADKAIKKAKGGE
jgi:hypothetical protein